MELCALLEPSFFAKVLPLKRYEGNNHLGSTKTTRRYINDTLKHSGIGQNAQAYSIDGSTFIAADIMINLTLSWLRKFHGFSDL